MSSRNEDEAWRSIVENYGDRADVEPLPPAEEPARSRASYDEDGTDREDRDPWDDIDGFVPPEPPPLPHPPPVQLAAWLGVFAAPGLLLIALVAGMPLPTLVSYGLVGWFVAGFLYLVFHMQRGPRDPGDDGARV